MKAYKTETEAQSKIDIYLKRGPIEFCPLISKICNPKCLCAIAPHISNNDAKYVEDLVWYAEDWSCCNYMFFGPIV